MDDHLSPVAVVVLVVGAACAVAWLAATIVDVWRALR